MNLSKIIREHRHDEAELVSVVEGLIEQAKAQGWIECRNQSKKSMWLVGRAEIGEYLGGNSSDRTVSRLLAKMRAAGINIPGTKRNHMLKPAHIDEFLETGNVCHLTWESGKIEE